MLKSSNWMQKEITLVEVKPSSKNPRKEAQRAFAVPCNLLLSCFPGTTWTTAWEQMSLSGSSQKALPVPAFTWQPGHWRWATLVWIWGFFFSSLLTGGEIWALSVSLSDPASKSPALVFTVRSNGGRNSRNLLENLAALHEEKGLVLFLHVGSPQ